MQKNFPIAAKNEINLWKTSDLKFSLENFAKT